MPVEVQSDAASLAPESADAELEVRDEDGGTLRVPLLASPLVVGRSSQAPLRLNSPTVSRRHAEFVRDPFGRWWVRDLQSRNGTRINDLAVDERVLQNGDVIHIGAFALTYLQHAAPNEASEVETAETTMPVDDSYDTRIKSLESTQTARLDTMHLSTLTEFGQRLLVTGDVKERLRLLCRLMVRHDFHGRAAVVLRVARHKRNVPPQLLSEPVALPGEGDGLPYVSRSLLNAVRQSESPVIASNAAYSDPGAIEMSITPEMTQMAAMACPLRSDDQTVDLLYVTLPPEYGTAEWLALGALAAQQFKQAEAAIIARRQAEQHAAVERELTKAQAIQKRLVPAKPSVAGLDIAVGFEPCRWVGGDYVDVIPRREGGVTLVIADVAGKGLPAALVTAELHAITHASVRAGAPIAETVAALNDHLCEHLDDRTFVTALLIALDPDSGAFEAINAGHPGGLFFKPDGSHRRMDEGRNIPLGLDQHEFTIESGSIDTGEVLLLYTDGLSELRDAAGEMVGPEGVTDSLRRIVATPNITTANTIANRLTAWLDELQGRRMPDDDRTFLIARRK